MASCFLSINPSFAYLSPVVSRFPISLVDLATERERQLTTGKRTERTAGDFRSPICRSATGQTSCLICARLRQLRGQGKPWGWTGESLPFLCYLSIVSFAPDTKGWFSKRRGTSVDDGARKSNKWPMEERQIGHRKSCLVLSARFSVVNWRFRPVGRPVAKSAY